jgi:carbonic anhydrase
MPQDRFATAINCMDGRVHLPVLAYLQERCGVDHVDMSISRHGSRHIAIVAHHDCAGNPVDKQTQLQQLAAAVKLIKEWGRPAEVIGLWVDENWMVEEVE